MAGHQGWIKLYRKLLDSPIWNIDEKRDKGAAWIDLMLLANHKDHELLFKDGVARRIIKRGQLHTSMVNLAERWHWNRRTVKKYLDVLEESGMIRQECTTHGITITIENYAFYQSEGRESAQQSAQQSAHEQECKEYKEYKECKEDKNDKNPLSLSNPDLKKVIQAYEETGMQISTTTASDFADLIGRYSADWVIEAIKAANRAGRDHVRVNYITGILRNWEERGGIDDGRSDKHDEYAEAEERLNRQLANDIF